MIGLGETPRGVTESQVRTSFSLLKDLDVAGLCFQDPPIHEFAGDDTFGYENPQRPHRLWERSFANYSELGVHTVLLDLLGKKTNLPVHALMGGAFRQSIPVDYWMGRMDPEASARLCRQAQREGYRGVKCKCALEDNNVERAEAIQEVCGQAFKMTFDPNGRFYRPGEALPMLKRLAAVGNVGCLEDPFPISNIQWYRHLRRQCALPVAMHLNCGPALITAIRADVCDYFNITDLPWNTRKAADLCWLAGVPTWYGSGVDLGVTEALMLHVCATAKSMTRPSDILGPDQPDGRLRTAAPDSARMPGSGTGSTALF